MMLDSAQLPEAFLEAFGISRESGYVFKVVKSADGQLNVQNVLDRDGNELGTSDEPMDHEDQGAQAPDPLDVVDDAIEHHTPLQLEEMNSGEIPWHGPAAGCTAVCAIVSDNHLVVANAGDSRCVLSRDGKAVALTEDHKPNNEEEFSRIMKAGGFVADGRVNGSLNLSRALGDLEYKQAQLPPEERLWWVPGPGGPNLPLRRGQPRSLHATSPWSGRAAGLCAHRHFTRCRLRCLSVATRPMPSTRPLASGGPHSPQAMGSPSMASGWSFAASAITTPLPASARRCHSA